MAKVLVVDDSASDRRLAGILIASHAGLNPVYATHGREALAVIEQDRPDVLLTDLQMPEMGGLELVEAVRRSHPGIPVILMTVHGNEEIAVQALRKGAASYVAKRNLVRDLAETLDSVLAVSKAEAHQQRALECLARTETDFCLDNDTSLIPPLVGHLQQNLTRLSFCDETGLIRVAVALREAVINAIEHGNLEVNSDLRERDDESYRALVAQRRNQEPYRSRRVRLTAHESRAKAVYVVQDEGPGFDPAALPDPREAGNLEKVSGRGLLLIRTFMDEVRHDDGGRRITMVKRSGEGEG